MLQDWMWGIEMLKEEITVGIWLQNKMGVKEADGGVDRAGLGMSKWWVSLLFCLCDYSRFSLRKE